MNERTIALVTGANKGIGRAVAEQLAGARSRRLGEEVAATLPGRLAVANAAAPGFCATDANAHTGTLAPADGAAVVVGLATLGAGGPTGGFFGKDGAMPW